MRRGVEAVRRAGALAATGRPRTRPVSAATSAFQTLIVGSSARRRQPLRTTAPLRSAPPPAAAASTATRRGSGASETGRISRGGTSSCCALSPSTDTGQDVKQPQQLRPTRAPQLEQQLQQHNAKTSTMDQRDADDVARTLGLSADRTARRPTRSSAPLRLGPVSATFLSCCCCCCWPCALRTGIHWTRPRQKWGAKMS